MIAHIQTKNGKVFSYAARQAEEGFRQRGAELQYFEPNNGIPQIELGDVIVAGVGIVIKALEQYPDHVNKIRDIDYPEPLRPFCNREIKEITMKEAMNLKEEDLPLFIKPRLCKKFTGFVLHTPESILDHKVTLVARDDMPLYTSEVVEFVSEYRVYIIKGKIMNICRYVGKVENYPNVWLIRKMIEAYKPAPIAYVLDVGVLADGTTALVEQNSALSVGNYGLCPSLHAKMIECRWFELTGQEEELKASSWIVLDSPTFLSER